MHEPDKIPRLSRLTAILLKLRSRPYITVKDLSKEFQVSTRTIYRDIASLEEAGVPIMVEEGKGFSLIEGYTIPPVMFTESEANALIMAEKFIATTKDGSLIQEFNKAIEKIKAVLPPEELEKIELLAERTIIGKNWANSRTSSYLSEIQSALVHHHPVQVSYLKKDAIEATERVLEPFAIYHNTSDQWVLIAWCRLREEFRSFRIDRIEKLYTLNETFAPHEMTMEEYVEIQRKLHAERTVT